MKAYIDVTVRQSGGAYITSPVLGQRASCTAGEEQTARRLGEKLYGDRLLKVEPVKGTYQVGMTVWRLHYNGRGR